MINSPFTGKPAILEKMVDPLIIGEGYREIYNIEVDYLLNGQEIFLYRCEDTGFRFFYPFDIGGDSNFYSKLQQYEWYYIPWKWEHGVCDKQIKRGSSLLEVGCAKGDFLKRIKKEKEVKVTGLELNNEAIKEGEKNGVHILNETIQDHSLRNRGTYDMVCSFQVLEHIFDVKSFIQSQIDCLKKGGKLVIAVPNNDSFINLDNNNLLNHPPHHMGLWNPKSLYSLEEIFDIKLVDFFLEPLQEIHFQWFFFNKIKKLQAKNLIIGKVVEKFTKPIYKPLLRRSKNYIIGHTMLAVFQK